MNTDQSLLEFSIFYPEAGFSKSKLFFFGIFLIRSCRKMTARSSSKSIVQKLLKSSVLMHLQHFVVITGSFFMLQHTFEPFCSSIISMRWFFPCFFSSFLIMSVHLVAWSVSAYHALHGKNIFFSLLFLILLLFYNVLLWNMFFSLSEGLLLGCFYRWPLMASSNWSKPVLNTRKCNQGICNNPIQGVVLQT